MVRLGHTSRLGQQRCRSTPAIQLIGACSQAVLCTDSRNVPEPNTRGDLPTYSSHCRLHPLAGWLPGRMAWLIVSPGRREHVIYADRPTTVLLSQGSLGLCRTGRADPPNGKQEEREGDPPLRDDQDPPQQTPPRGVRPDERYPRFKAPVAYSAFPSSYSYFPSIRISAEYPKRPRHPPSSYE